ncbi:MAG: hypothetical protein PHE59_00285 [Patescibacteria group bacterium]|nr:hypothetical protein [Patescibacteria group bacterium]MDD5164444.1 hypothetical protein [Patescibacteria group bacterium]MDD5534363.1 hypothetical protein [Patescibacteria group bacterium]
MDKEEKKLITNNNSPETFDSSSSAHHFKGSEEEKRLTDLVDEQKTTIQEKDEYISSLEEALEEKSIEEETKVKKLSDNNFLKSKNHKVLYIIITVLVLIIIGGGLFFFLGNNDVRKETQAPKGFVDCGETTAYPSCFLNRMNECLPVTEKMMDTDDSGNFIEITILGKENETCHFQAKMNNILISDCYFPKGTLQYNTIWQTLGSYNGSSSQKAVDENCKSGW